VVLFCHACLADVYGPVDSLFEAQKNVEELKKDYGNGISTMIIIHNNMDRKLEYRQGQGQDQKDEGVGGWNAYHGRWQNFDLHLNQRIPAGKFKPLLHVKTSGSLYGSQGWVAFRIYDRNIDDDTAIAYIGWDTPYWGTNELGVGVHNIRTPNPYVLKKLTEGQYLSPQEYKANGHKIKVEGKFIKDESSPMILYTFSDEQI